MIKKIYALRDTKADYYSSPWYAENDMVAKRNMVEYMNTPNKETMPQKFPADFTLWKLGEFNDQNGEFKNDQQNLGALTEYVTK